MSKIVDIRVIPRNYKNIQVIQELAAAKLKISRTDITEVVVIRRSIDARGRKPLYQLRVEVTLGDEDKSLEDPMFSYRPLKMAKDVLIIGAGPTGYFAALRCIERGLRPIVLDRGKDVQSRRRDLKQIQQYDTVNPDSNYCYGEGGAGTYSDGKLYTRSNKRGNVKKILQILVDHGALSDILIDAHPHIGSNKLPKIIANIRDTIEACGGEIHFNSKVTDFILEAQRFVGVQVEDGKIYKAGATVLATGHSARDIYLLCSKHKIPIEFKPFAIGARLEHPQPLIDKIQYNQLKREEDLPAASYSLSCQSGGHGVFSFCMCPGGLIVPSATSPGEIVVNGMSLSHRDSPYANAATVVTLDENPEPGNPYGGMNYQEALEQKIFNMGDGSQAAPAQRLTDFVSGTLSKDLPNSSYIPGIYAAPMHEMFPSWIVDNIRKAVKIFDQKMKGFYTSEAQLVGLESRTSAPVRIPRDRSTYMCESVEGLFPAGEGAGYAGGILSAALDGDRIVDHIADYLQVNTGNET